MSIYIAAPFFNEKQLDMVERIENALDKLELKYFSPRSEGILIDMSPEQKANKMKSIFNSNVMNINCSSAIVAVIDNWDTGTVWEMGYAHRGSIPIFTISDNDYGLNVMVRQSVRSHNTKISNLMVNLIEHENNRPITLFEELTKEVT